MSLTPIHYLGVASAMGAVGAALGAEADSTLGDSRLVELPNGDLTVLPKPVGQVVGEVVLRCIGWLKETYHSSFSATSEHRRRSPPAVANNYMAYATNGTCSPSPCRSSIQAVDLLGKEVIASTPLSGTYSRGTVTPDGQYVLLATGDANTVDVFAGTDVTVVARIPFNGGPMGVAIAPQSDVAYVIESVPFPGMLSVIKIPQFTVSHRISLCRESETPYGITIAPDGRRLYTNDADGGICVIDTVGLKIIKHIATGVIPYPGVIATNGPSLFVGVDNEGIYSSGGGGAITIVNTTDYSVETLLTGGSRLVSQLAVTLDGREIYVASWDRLLRIIDAFHNTITAPIKLPANVDTIGFTPDGQNALLRSDEGLYVFGIARRKIIGTIGPIEDMGYVFAINPIGEPVTPLTMLQSSRTLKTKLAAGSAILFVATLVTCVVVKLLVPKNPATPPTAV